MALTRFDVVVDLTGIVPKATLVRRSTHARFCFERFDLYTHLVGLPSPNPDTASRLAVEMSITDEREVCGSRGPRIGGQDESPRCGMLLHHAGSHCGFPGSGFDDVTWGDPALRDVAWAKEYAARVYAS